MELHVFFPPTLLPTTYANFLNVASTASGPENMKHISLFFLNNPGKQRFVSLFQACEGITSAHLH